MRLTCTSLVLAGLLAACAPLDDQVTDADNWADQESCRTTTKTGSRIGEKTCRTGRQWRQREIDEREARESAAARAPGAVFGEYDRVDVRD